MFYVLFVQGLKITLSIFLLYLCLFDPNSGILAMRVFGTLVACFMIYDGIDRIRNA